MSMLSDYKKKLKSWKLGKPMKSKPFYERSSFSVPGSGSYKAWKFKTLGPAKKKQASMKKMYGYTPEIIGVSKKGKFLQYTVVEPKGLTKVSDM